MVHPGENERSLRVGSLWEDVNEHRLKSRVYTRQKREGWQIQGDLHSMNGGGGFASVVVWQRENFCRLSCFRESSIILSSKLRGSHRSLWAYSVKVQQRGAKSMKNELERFAFYIILECGARWKMLGEICVWAMAKNKSRFTTSFFKSLSISSFIDAERWEQEELFWINFKSSS